VPRQPVGYWDGNRATSREGAGIVGPVGTRDLIINVDDIGIHEGAVAAAVETLVTGVAASGSVMTVCPGARAALELLADHRDLAIGVHLTLTAGFPAVPWAPLTGGRSIQHHGLMMGIEQREQLLAQAVITEVEAEFRAQIEALMAAGLRPTHLDWHCLADGGREDVFDLTLALADEYGTAVRAWGGHGRAALRGRGRASQDQPFLDSFTLPVEGKQERVLAMVHALPPGLSEWAFHPANPILGDPGSDVRSSDRDVLMSPWTRTALREEAVTVIGQHDLRSRPAIATGEPQGIADA